MIAALSLLARCTSWAFVAKFYIAPFLVTNHWCALFTLLASSVGVADAFVGAKGDGDDIRTCTAARRRGITLT